jgi:uncharacterized protein GlcG (DUF336 family)
MMSILRHDCVRTALVGIAGSLIVLSGLPAAHAAPPFGYVGPSATTSRRSPLSPAEIGQILSQGVAQANKEPSLLRPSATTRMHVAIVDRSGLLLGFRSMDDAWEGSKDIAIAKARTAAFFSSNQNAMTSRTVGVLSQANFPTVTDLAGPLWGIGNSNQQGITGGPERRNGLITFPGGVPIYKNGVLIGGVGVSGDGVDQDEAVAIKAAAGFDAPMAIRANTVVPALPYTTATPKP